MTTTTLQPFTGWRVVWAAFIVAVFGWGVGFYGPPVFLFAVHEARGWSIPLVSAAVTCHFLLGAGAVSRFTVQISSPFSTSEATIRQLAICRPPS